MIDGLPPPRGAAVPPSGHAHPRLHPGEFSGPEPKPRDGAPVPPWSILYIREFFNFSTMRFDKRKPAGSDITRLTLNVDGITATISRESPVRLPGWAIGRITAFRARWNGAFIPLEWAADDKVRSLEME